MAPVCALIVLAIAGSCECVSAADAARTQVAPVGAYHSSDSAKDIHNVQASRLADT
jgi:hypothetical protein